MYQWFTYVAFIVFIGQSNKCLVGMRYLSGNSFNHCLVFRSMNFSILAITKDIYLIK